MLSKAELARMMREAELSAPYAAVRRFAKLVLESRAARPQPQEKQNGQND
jgi:hypothetical protein